MGKSFAPGPPPHIADDVTWTRTVSPRERYRITYVDRAGVSSERTVDLLKIGNSQGVPYVSVLDAGKPKTFRTDRIIAVLEQLTTGHAPSLFAAPTYRTQLPHFPVSGLIVKIPTTHRSNRTWTVDLDRYTCTCPEKRIRSAHGYAPGQLGMVCDHMAKAILDKLPADHSDWSPALLDFLSDGHRIAVHNLN